MQDLKDLKSRFFQQRFRRCEEENLGYPVHLVNPDSDTERHGEGQALALR